MGLYGDFVRRELTLLMRFKAISAGDGVHKLESVLEQPETRLAV